MSLSAQILNSDAQLNNFEVLGSITFIPGEQIDMVLRLHQTARNLRYVPGSSAILTLFITQNDGTTISKIMTLDADDRSIARVTIQETESELLQSGAIRFDLDELGDGSVITKGIIRSALRRETASC